MGTEVTICDKSGPPHESAGTMNRLDVYPELWVQWCLSRVTAGGEPMMGIAIVYTIAFMAAEPTRFPDIPKNEQRNRTTPRMRMDGPVFSVLWWMPLWPLPLVVLCWMEQFQ